MERKAKVVITSKVQFYKKEIDEMREKAQEYYSEEKYLGNLDNILNFILKSLHILSIPLAPIEVTSCHHCPYAKYVWDKDLNKHILYCEKTAKKIDHHIPEWCPFLEKEENDGHS